MTGTFQLRGQCKQALALIRASGAVGLTARQISDAMRWSPNQTATRLGELREAGLTGFRAPVGGEDADEAGFAIRPTTPGHHGRVHVAIAAATDPAPPQLSLL